MVEFIKRENDYSRFHAKIENEQATILWIYVVPKERQRGYAREIIEEFEQECLARAVDAIKLYAWFESIPFWQKVGYEVNMEPQVINGCKQDFHDANKKIIKEEIRGIDEYITAS